MEVVFHRRIQADLRSALAFYETEGGCRLGDRFFAEAEDAVAAALKNPKSFHFAAEGLRRVATKTFPYHFLYEEDAQRIRFLVLRHDKRHPRFGLNRR
ncbi:hypothetical protein [Luteolibacter sp. LG18]|uniref:hypothetical protein n=1 Tax=Luteolibacter sp. LG18 TaxID=2819286 RepID=UPI0030C75E14